MRLQIVMFFDCTHGGEMHQKWKREEFTDPDKFKARIQEIKEWPTTRPSLTYPNEFDIFVFDPDAHCWFNYRNPDSVIQWLNQVV